MSPIPIRLVAPWLVPVLCASLLVSGCASIQLNSGPSQLPDESVSLITTLAQESVFDAATLVFLNHNFAVELSNERIGVLQTDYLPLTAVEATLPDSLRAGGRIKGLEMRITLNLQERADDNLVRLRASVQRTNGRAAEADKLIARYWLEHVAFALASELDTTFHRNVSRRDYVAATETRNAAIPSSRIVRGGAIILIALFVATLISGVLSPGA